MLAKATDVDKGNFFPRVFFKWHPVTPVGGTDRLSCHIINVAMSIDYGAAQGCKPDKADF